MVLATSLQVYQDHTHCLSLDLERLLKYRHIDYDAISISTDPFNSSCRTWALTKLATTVLSEASLFLPIHS